MSRKRWCSQKIPVDLRLEFSPCGRVRIEGALLGVEEQRDAEGRVRAFVTVSTASGIRRVALDEVGAVTREALHAAPHDPVINQYYLAAQSALAATIRQIDRAGAPTMLVGSY